MSSEKPLFTLAELQKSNFPSVREWDGAVLPDSDYLEAFHKTFPNLIKFSTRIEGEETDKQLEFMHDFVNRDDIWPKLEMFTYDSTDYDKRNTYSFVENWLKDRSNEEHDE
jgi:hypothetical protein